MATTDRPAATSPLIDATRLRELLARPDRGGVTVLDVRYRLGGPPGAEEFARGHVPGSSYVDLDTALAAPVRGDRVGGRHPLPDADVFVSAMRKAGVSSERPVVVLDDWQGRAAGRAWWLLRDHGHPDVRVLDGGWSAWLVAGGEVETGSSDVVAGDFDGRPGHLPRVEADELLDFEGTIVDAREGERFRGEVEPVDPVAGHVPGAVNAPTSANLTPAGTFRPASELAGLYPEGPVAVYCGSGVTATHDLLALAVLGREGVLYPGSWSDWVSDETRPTATGPA